MHSRALYLTWKSSTSTVEPTCPESRFPLQSRRCQLVRYWYDAVSLLCNIIIFNRLQPKIIICSQQRHIMGRSLLPPPHVQHTSTFPALENDTLLSIDTTSHAINGKPCHLAASGLLEKLTGRQSSTIRVDGLLNIHREVTQTVHSVLNCRRCLGREPSHSMFMLLFMLLESFLACLEARLEASAGSRCVTSVQSLLCAGGPLVIGKFIVDIQTTTEFVKTLMMEALDAQLALLLRLQTKAESVLKGTFRRAATEMVSGMRERLSLVRGLFLLSEVAPNTFS